MKPGLHKLYLAWLRFHVIVVELACGYVLASLPQAVQEPGLHGFSCCAKYLCGFNPHYAMLVFL